MPNYQERLKAKHARAATRAVAGNSVAEHVYNGQELKFEWDPTKRKTTLQERGFDFNNARFFSWATADYYPEIDRGELQHVAVGYLGDRLVYIVYTERDGNLRIISMRPASRRERGLYGER